MKNLVEFNDMWFSENTCIEVKTALVNAYRSNKRFRIWYGFTEHNSIGDNNAGKSWDEENDVCGYIGKSTGSYGIPLLVYNNSSMGGSALLDDSIIKIVEIKTKKVIYQHPNFNQSVFTSVGNSVIKDGKVFGTESLNPDEPKYANFKNVNQAQRYADFMNGVRMCK